MTVFNAYLKIVKKQYPMILIYVGITLFFAIFATNTSSQDTTNFLAEKPKMTIINEDNDADFTKNFVDYVSKNAEIVDIPNEEEALADALFYGEINCYLKIPKGYSEKFLKGENPQIEIKKSTNSYATYTEMLLEKYLNIAKAYNISGMNETEIINNINKDLEKTVDIKVENKMDSAVFAKVKFYYNFANYGFLVLCIYIAGVVIREFNEQKIKRRNIISKTSYKKINSQLLLGNAFLVFFIWFIYVTISIILYSNVMLTTNGLWFIINSFIFCITALTIGSFVGNLVKSKDAINGIVNVIALGSSFICGAFVPQEYLPEAVLNCAKILPSYWFITNNNTIASTTNFTKEIINNIIIHMVIILIFSVIFIIANNIVSWKKRKE